MSMKMHWMHGQAAPEAVLERLVGQCKHKNAKGNAYKNSALVWTIQLKMCRLQTCGNRKDDDGYDAPEYDSECSDLDEAEQ